MLWISKECECLRHSQCGVAFPVVFGLAIAVLLFLPVVGSAQTITGQISGRITDSSGGVLPGVTVTVVNEGTGFTESRVTDRRPVHVHEPPRRHLLGFARVQGFRKEQRTGFSLTADGRLSADFSLGVGELNESVEVTATLGETVNRTSGEVARTIDSQQIKDLAFNGRNYLELASLIPGAVATDFDPLALATSLSVTGQSINGSRGNTNNLTVDGGSNLDSGSNGSQVNNVSLSFIEQVKIQTANFSAELGRNSGGQINVVTRSGTNKFQGTARYDFRDEKFDEPNYFAARDANGNRTKPALEFKNFEGALVARFCAISSSSSAASSTGHQPLHQPDAADLADPRRARWRLFLAPPRHRQHRRDRRRWGTADPATGLQFPGNVIPSGRITTDGRAIANTYTRMIDLASEYASTPTANNATYQLYNPFEQRQDILRIDWQATGNQRVHGRYLHDEYDLLDPYGVFSNAALPTVPTNRSRPGTSYQIGHTWVVRPTLVNEARISAAWNGQRINPQGDTWLRDTYGYQFPELYPGGFITDGIPSVSVSGFAALTSPSFALLSPTTDITFQDTLTYSRSTHSIRAGFAVSRNRKDQNGRAAYLGNVAFNPSGNPNSTNNALADALLGNFRTYNEASADPVGFFRFTLYQGTCRTRGGCART